MKLAQLNGVFLGIGSALLMLGGCPCGFDPTKISLDPSMVKYYSQDVEAGRGPIDAVVYGVLSPGGGSAASASVLSMRYDDIFRDLNKVKAMTKSHGFTPAEAASLTAWAEALEKNVQTTVGPAVGLAVSNANGAKNLAAQVEGYVSSAGSLNGTLTTGQGHVPQAAKEDFKVLAASLKSRFEKLYQSAVATAQAIKQKEASKHLATIRSSLSKLKKHIEAVAPIIPNVLQRDRAIDSLTEAENKRLAAANVAGQMTSPKKISRMFVNASADLDAAVAQVNAQYIGHVVMPTKTETDEVYRELDQAKTDLRTVATDFDTNIEDLKRPVDAQLIHLVDQAFKGDIAVALGIDSIDEKTDINTLIDLFVSNDSVVMPNDASSSAIAWALASAVVHHNAETQGLKRNAVVGPNHEFLNELKQKLALDNDQYRALLVSRAQKMCEQHQEDIVALFADEYGLPDVADMVDEYLKCKSKVLIFSKNKTAYKNSKSFSHGYLKVPEGVVIGIAMIKEEDPKISPMNIVEPLIKSFAAFGKFTIGNLAAVIRDVVRLLPNANVATSDDIQGAISTVLAARDVPTHLIAPSSVLRDDPQVVQRNLSANRQYYFERALVGDADMRTRWIEEQRRNRLVADRLQLALDANNVREVRKTQLNVAFRGYKGAINAVSAGFDIHDTVRDYAADIDVYRRDAIGTLNSMDALLDNNLCLFASAGANYDAGYNQFVAQVSKQPFSEIELKNPMSLFVIDESSVTAPGAPTDIHRAAIGLNCFLTAPGRNNLNDGRFVLHGKVAFVKNRVNAVIRDAETSAARMRTNNLAILEAEYATLADKMNDVVGGAFNVNYWKRELSKHKAAVAGPVVKPVMGANFDVKSYVKPYPVANQADILPNIAGFNNLPSSFFAEYVGFGGNPFDAGNNRYGIHAGGLQDVWTIAKVYAVSLKNGPPVPANPNPPMALGAVATPRPAYIPAHADFLKLNNRIWTWFLSRIVGKITDQIPLVANPNELYALQGGVDYFDNDHVFIKQLFKRTPEFLNKVNRYLIAKKALMVLEEYKGMAELLYSLPPDDFNGFLNQAPGNDLTAFFARIQNIMSKRKNINLILAANGAALGANWFSKFYHGEVAAALPGGGGADQFVGAAPPAGADNQRLLAIWGQLVAAAARIEALADTDPNSIRNRIALIP